MVEAPGVRAVTLEDEIAQRLCRVLEQELPELYRRAPCGFDARSTRACAREAIRLMEWARQRGIRFGLVCRGLRQGLVTDSPSGADEISAIAAKDPLTLPPDDWPCP